MLSMMMEFSPAGRAGTFLGFWTMMVTMSRGVGVSGGGIVRDIGLSLTGDPAWAYAIVFLLEAGGLVIALCILTRISVKTFRTQHAASFDPISLLAESAE
jgi:BCD family chlorophyll transporter-like MFS transporter